ncbi:uncharacterized protein LOC133191436 [Saccostrea echinata]|uniref:uncharacterized protein LOC133191436 n=1 Tax=Saccostrea echinata TaxID=191078 RepID=UPI002A841510|nr:uncharacterized protein LOC133191436 [Saccostrea echinata]
MSFEVIYRRTNEKQDGYTRRSVSSEIINQYNIKDSPSSSSSMSAILTSDHVTNEELNMYRQWAFICECIIRHVHNVDTIVTGSRIDCSASSGSDEDQMLQVKDTEVVTSVDCDVSMAGNVLIMNTNNCPPGFTLLNPYKLSRNEIRHETRSCVEACIQSNDVLYLSSETYIKYVMNMIAGMDKYSPPSFHAGDSLRHGPCVMLSYSKYEKDSDIGIGLKCSSWPKDSLEWISRKRKSNWPNQLLINKIKGMPCHALPVGCVQSEKCHLEWRFAFILPERELIWNFSDVQIQCYVIFKTLKKEILDKIISDEINSFHLKTIVFWMSEEIPDWDPSNLTNCVKACLSFLIKCIQQRHLSHYFLRSRNLFMGKLEDEMVRDRLISEIELIRENIIDYFINCEWWYKSGSEYLLSLRLFAQEAPKVDFLAACKAIMETGNRKLRRNKYTHARCLSMEVTVGIMFLQTTVESLLKVAEEVDEQLKTLMGDFALKFLSIRVGMLFLVDAKNTVDLEMRRKLISESKRCLEAGLQHDVLAATMYLLTYHYQARNYSVIQKFLKDIFGRRAAIPYKGTPGLFICGKRSLLSPDMDETVTVEDMANENDVAFDFIFSCSDISCVPPALQYECALLEGRSNWCFCSVNPLVYVCYVQFQVAFNLRDTEQLSLAIEHLKSMVLYVENGEECSSGMPVELHRHYNIMGYCYRIINDVQNAIKWFMKSLEACPTNGNAAAYHLCIALYDLFLSVL